jgi:hypothetical protein
VVSERDQSVALIADQPGQFTVPELHLSWWDTQANQAREAVIPAKTIEVTPAPGSQATAQTAPPPPIENNTQPSAAAPSPTPISSTGSDNRNTPAKASPWPWISLALGLLWVGTVVAWLISRRRPGGIQPPPTLGRAAPPADASRARSAFQAACRTNDPLAARRNLIAWVNAEAPTERIAGLSALSKRIEDSNTVRLLRDLDRACYVGGNWDGTALAAALNELMLRERPEAASKPVLEPLYH